MQNPDNIEKAYYRINNYIYNTPLLYSETLNKILNSQFYFKMDTMQKTGSFKLRGVLNHILNLKEKNKIPKKVVTYSTGNHGLALAYTAKLFGIQARIYLPKNVAAVKKKTTKYYGGEIIEVKSRLEAEYLSKKDGNNDFYYLHPSDDNQIIAGAGTMCYEALIEMRKKNIKKPDAIFASCGGGGLLAGSYLAKELLSPSSKLIGVEPENANDAYKSLQSGKVQKFMYSPQTIADGLRALSISERTFNYLKKLDDFYTCSEESIIYWTTWFIQKMQVTCEPSSAISMAGAYNWLKKNTSKKIILILISGGNIDLNLYTDICKNTSIINDCITL